MRKIIVTVLVLAATSTASFAAMQERQTKKSTDSTRIRSHKQTERFLFKPAKAKAKAEKSFKDELIDWLLKFE